MKMTNDEWRMAKGMQKDEMLNASQRPDFVIRASSLIRHSSFGFRHSS
jgi:hypothetical protein